METFVLVICYVIAFAWLKAMPTIMSVCARYELFLSQNQSLLHFFLKFCSPLYSDLGDGAISLIK